MNWTELKHRHPLLWRRGLAALVAVHLVFVGCGAARIKLPDVGRADGMVARYLGFSGAHYSWGFFAPNIGSQFKTQFEIHLKDGSSLTRTLGGHGPSEVLLREAGIASTFWFGLQDQKLRRAISASLAASALSRTPNADRVDVEISAYYFPSMRQIRRGTMPRWVPVYSASFASNDSTAVTP